MEPLTEGARGLIEGARNLIERKGWCQGKAAETHSGEAVSANNARACRFCATGALDLVSVGRPIADRLAASQRLTEMARKLGGTRIIDVDFAVQDYNDTIARTPADILAFFDAALEETP